jgi:pimeloyl-ACP methyl ester carboxylesterase
LSLYVRDYPGHDKRRAVLCLGGLTRNAKDFHTLAERLSPRYRVICPDYRGRGRSDYDPQWSNYTPPTYIDDTRQVAAALNIHAYAVIGTSLGGLLAMGLGVASPSSVKGVLLNDVCPDLPISMLGSIVTYASAVPELSDWAAAAAYLRDHAPIMPPASSDHVDELVHNTFRERADGKIVFDWDRNITRPLSENTGPQMDIWSLFSALKDVPVLSVRGGLSPFVNDDSCQKMAAIASGMRFVTAPDAGHAPTLTEAMCDEAIDGWLGDCFKP